MQNADALLTWNLHNAEENRSVLHQQNDWFKLV